jgi:uncharacterized protein involved in tellurium resistance
MFNKFLKWLLIFAFLYFGTHAYLAFGQVVINLPDGGQRVCVMQQGVVTCY